MEVKIIGNLESFEILNRYEENDVELLTPYSRIIQFDPTTDFIEVFNYDIAGNFLNSNLNFLKYTSDKNTYVNPDGTFNTIEIDPVAALQGDGYASGEFVSQYNFLRKLIEDDQQNFFFKEISSDRTEIRLGSHILTEEEIKTVFDKLQLSESTPYTQEFLISLGENKSYLIVNSLLNGDEILLKLYQPLDQSVQLKDTLSIVEELISSYKFSINLSKLVIPDAAPTLRGANFDIDIKTNSQSPTSYQTYNSLINDASTSGSYQRLLSGLSGDQGIGINVDYTDFNSFIHFSSAARRVENLRFKFEDILENQAIIDDLGGDISAASVVAKAKNDIDAMVLSFDGFEKFNYFENDSKAWPKVDNNRPYQLMDVNAPQVQNWYAQLHDLAVLYDNNNPDHLVNHAPLYIKEDENNAQYLEFTDMMGQFFDTVWIKIKSVTDLYRNENELNKGISRDLVYAQLKSLGINPYESSIDDSLFNQMIGQNSGSIALDNIPQKDILDEKYKRIYNNLPYLIQSKGTIEGIRALITCFGIPESILDITEFGGDDKSILPNIGGNQATNSKVRVEDNQIYGDVLTPFISVEQKSPTKTNDLNLLEISFSLTKNVNENILITYPTLNFDNLLGDPSDEYNNKYTQLDYLNRMYFTVNGKPYKYTEFVQLLKYIDNSLFKLIKDFVPGRANVSIGAVVEPNILERNKIARSKPEFEFIEVVDAVINGPKISHAVEKLFDDVSGDKSSYITGELDGSELEVSDYYNTLGNPYKVEDPSLSRTEFKHSDYDVLLNNVSGSIFSKSRRKLENGILSRTELQDSYESLATHQLSRYDGVKLTSKGYNDYVDGDVSFGKTSAIDNHVSKIGLFNELSTNIFLGGNKNDVVIKYLVDINGDLTELNKNNYNWFEIQNTFIKDDNLTVSLFDAKKYGNQKTSEGVKAIYNSGYSYEPTLYFSLNSKLLSFQIPGYLPSVRVLAKNQYSSGSISGGTPSYPLSSNKVVSNIFDLDDESFPINNYLTGSVGSSNYLEFPRYVTPSDSSYDIDIDLAMNVSESISSAGYVSYNLGIYKNLTSFPTSQTPVLDQTQTYVVDNSSGYSPASKKAWLLAASSDSGSVQETASGLNAYSNSDYTTKNGPRRYTVDIECGGISNMRIGDVIRTSSDRTGRFIDVIVDEYIMSGVNINERVQRLRDKLINILNGQLNTILEPDNNIRTAFRNVLTSGDYFHIFGEVYYISGGNGRLTSRSLSTYKNVVGSDPLVTTTDILQSDGVTVAVPKGTTMYKYNFREIDPATSTVGGFTSVYSTVPTVRLSGKYNPGNTEFASVQAGYNGTNFVNFSYYYVNINNDFPLYLLANNSLGTITNNGKNWNFKMSLKSVFLRQNDVLTFVLKESDVYSGFNYNLDLNPATGSLNINGDPNIRTISNTITILIDPNLSIQNDNGYTRFIFNDDLSAIYASYSGSAYFAPSIDSTNELDIYQKYGDINQSFKLSPGDVLIVKDTSNYVYEFDIKTVEMVAGRLNIVLISVMDQILFDNLVSTNVNKRYFELLFLVKLKDETNAILSFNKKAGKTSWGFIIPSNLHPDVIKQIDTITKEVKQKLLSEQSIIDKISGGDF